VCQTISARLNALLVAIVGHVVGRCYHVRRYTYRSGFVEKANAAAVAPARPTLQSERGSSPAFPADAWGEVPSNCLACGANVAVV